MSKYRSPFSVANRQPIVVDKEDPRSRHLQNYKSKIGSKVRQVERKDNYPPEEWENGWYLRTVEEGVSSGFEISDNQVQTYISTDIEMYLNTDFDGNLVGENLNYVGGQWRFSKALDTAITGYVLAEDNAFLEAYSFDDKFVIDSFRLYCDEEFDDFIAFADSSYNNFVSVEQDSSGIIASIQQGSLKNWEKDFNVKAGSLGCVDISGRPYIATTDILSPNIIAFDTIGNIRWSKTISGLSESSGKIVKILSEKQQYDEFEEPITTDIYIYIIGYHTNTNTPFILKIDDSGTLIYSVEYDTNVILLDASIREDGIFLVGRTGEESDAFGFMLFVDNVLFLPVWSRLYKSTNAVENDFLSGCSISETNFYICGKIFSDTSSRLFAASYEGAFPLGNYDLNNNYLFSIESNIVEVNELTGISLESLSVSDAISEHLSFTLPDGIYGDVI